MAAKQREKSVFVVLHAFPGSGIGGLLGEGVVVVRVRLRELEPFTESHGVLEHIHTSLFTFSE
jgi:hypothetical protein